MLKTSNNQRERADLDLDLDLDHYTLEDIYNLLHIKDHCLTEDALKSAKQIVLKTHPDKSKLDASYFLFFSKAYKRLYSIYEFQNKSTMKKPQQQQQGQGQGASEYFEESNKMLLNNALPKDPTKFNAWFNQTFEKHRLVDPNEQGHGEWLKSNEDFLVVKESVNKANMNDVFEKQKKQLQAVTVYTGVTDTVAPMTFGGALLDSSSADFSTDEYGDLKQVYTGTILPVTQEDFYNKPKFATVSEYARHRNQVDVTPISHADAERQLLRQQQQNDQQSASLAFKYAKEAEQMKQKSKGFWADLKQIAGY